MSIMILGAKGNMGRRYAAILKTLKHPVIGFDVESTYQDFKNAIPLVDGIIIATPTPTHAHYLTALADSGKPILCEKPLSTNPKEVRRLMDLYRARKGKLRMVMQYQNMISGANDGESYYDYYNHGRDGLKWDCIQIIALAKRDFWLGESSPIWKCKINDKKLDIANMDFAYIDEIKHWLSRPAQDLGYLKAIHDKVAEFELE